MTKPKHFLPCSLPTRIVHELRFLISLSQSPTFSSSSSLWMSSQEVRTPTFQSPSPSRLFYFSVEPFIPQNLAGGIPKVVPDLEISEMETVNNDVAVDTAETDLMLSRDLKMQSKKQKNKRV